MNDFVESKYLKCHSNSMEMTNYINFFSFLSFSSKYSRIKIYWNTKLFPHDKPNNKHIHELSSFCWKSLSIPDSKCNLTFLKAGMTMISLRWIIYDVFKYISSQVMLSTWSFWGHSLKGIWPWRGLNGIRLSSI